MAIFHDMVEEFVGVFMDDFSVFQKFFERRDCYGTDLEVDKAKVEVIEKFPPPVSIKGVRTFLVHAGFYWKFIKDFSKIARPMCSILEKEELLFELMCDTFDVAAGAVLRQKKSKVFRSIYYASKTLDTNKVITHYQHLLNKKDAKLRLIHWILFLQKFDLEIKDRKAFFKQGVNRVVKRSILECEVNKVLETCDANPYGGHHREECTAYKMPKVGHYLKKTRDAIKQHFGGGNLLRMDIEFMGPFPPTKGSLYIIVVVDYVSKWVEDVPLPSSDSRVYGIHQEVATTYNSQMSGKVEVSNREVKKILQKTVNAQRKDSFEK
ncbi:uncharacterized protein LOC107003846 [Solanum pennellii]|uniref:Uncharacterized protein LOC107003846 n=1 Tax=Solanum pennellii TaxID=28526 RepID=A0ABM1FJ34_SOLPN|nr:uncharacterized protein LOC107003846 [Solanum pennellii]